MYQPYNNDDFVKVLKNQSLVGKSLFLNILTLSDIHQQRSSYGEVFTNLRKIVKLSLVISVFSVSAERNFSTMLRIKTYLNAATQSLRLSNFALLSIDIENSENY